MLGFVSGFTDTDKFLPNGIALARDGALFIANIAGEGGVWRTGTDGALGPYLMEVDGTKLVAANFVWFDRLNRMWITCSTRSADRSAPMNENVRDGFVVLVDDRGPRIVADSLAFTNECRIDGEGKALYVCETAGYSISRFPIRSSGELGPRQLFVEFAPGTYPDGCAFDSAGHLWMASPVSNRVIRVSPDGRQETVIEDSVPGHIETVEAARARGRFSRDHFYMKSGERLEAITSVAFGGTDLRTIYLGSLTNRQLVSFRSDVAGEAPVHWNFNRAF